MNRIDEYKAKKEEYEKLIKEEEEKAALSIPDPLFTEHLFQDTSHPEYGPMWARLRPVTAADFLDFVWKPDLPIEGTLERGSKWTPALTCQPVLKPSLVDEIVAKGGTDGLSSLARIFIGHSYRAYHEVLKWDGRCYIVATYLEKAEKICFARYKTIERRREVLSRYTDMLQIRAAHAGQQIVNKFITELNIAIDEWAKHIRDKLHNQAIISLLDPDNWVGGAGALLKEEQPSNRYPEMVINVVSQMDELRDAVKKVLLSAIKKSILKLSDKDYPEEVKKAVLLILEEKGQDAIPYDPFFQGHLPRRRHSS